MNYENFDKVKEIVDEIELLENLNHGLSLETAWVTVSDHNGTIFTMQMNDSKVADDHKEFSQKFLQQLTQKNTTRISELKNQLTEL